MQRGLVENRTRCEFCGGSDHIQAHHPDYDAPLSVVCHVQRTSQRVARFIYEGNRMTPLRLYEIADDVQAFSMESGFDEETGEMLPELVQALAAFEGKGAAVAAYVLNIEAEAEAIAQAAKRITARKRSLDARAEHMRDYLRYNMGLAGIMRIDAADHCSASLSHRAATNRWLSTMPPRSRLH